MSPPAGRYAPSPSGPLHIGNLRTAFAAWGWARSTGRSFVLRIENIDPHRTGAAAQQIADLRAVGIDWDGDIVYQTDRFAAYEQALEELQDSGHVFECFCSRKEIAEAVRAPHTPVAHYPGTCAHLSPTEREERRSRLAAQGRRPALRLRSPETTWEVHDEIAGPYRAPVDSFVLRRGDGAFAYNLASVVDDAHAGVDLVVRGDDLLPSSPAQAYLASLLGYPPPRYGHVTLVLGKDGKRLAKSDGAQTLADLRGLGWTAQRVISEISESLGAGPVSSSADFLTRFDPDAIPRVPFGFDAASGLHPFQAG